MALRQEKLPGELADAALMRFMGWGVRDLAEAHPGLVADIRSWMAKEAAIAAEQAAQERSLARSRTGGRGRWRMR